MTWRPFEYKRRRIFFPFDLIPVPASYVPTTLRSYFVLNRILKMVEHKNTGTTLYINERAPVLCKTNTSKFIRNLSDKTNKLKCLNQD